MALGKPVVVSAVGGLPEMVDHGKPARLMTRQGFASAYWNWSTTPRNVGLWVRKSMTQEECVWPTRRRRRNRLACLRPFGTMPAALLRTAQQKTESVLVREIRPSLRLAIDLDRKPQQFSYESSPYASLSCFSMAIPRTTSAATTFPWADEKPGGSLKLRCPACSIYAEVSKPRNPPRFCTSR